MEKAQVFKVDTTGTGEIISHQDFPEKNFTNTGDKEGVVTIKKLPNRVVNLNIFMEYDFSQGTYNCTAPSVILHIVEKSSLTQICPKTQKKLNRPVRVIPNDDGKLTFKFKKTTTDNYFLGFRITYNG